MSENIRLCPPNVNCTGACSRKVFEECQKQAQENARSWAIAPVGRLTGLTSGVSEATLRASGQLNRFDSEPEGFEL